MNKEIIDIVNKALEIYHSTPVEDYPESRAIDKLELITPPNSNLRKQCYDTLIWAIDNMNNGSK
jgi:hypothetical protein